MKDVPIIKRPMFLRYRFKNIRKNTNILFRKKEWEYYHHFSICYKYLRVSTFFKSKYWQYREKQIYIPKIINNLLKFIFGKRYYSVHRKESGYRYCSELVRYNTAKNYIEEYKKEGHADIYICEKELRYSSWLWITKKERNFENAWFKLRLNMWS